MKKARIIIGANYGDEGKGTVVAHYTKNAQGSVLNVLTNGGAQRGHSILTEDGSMTFQHFGSGTYHGADSCYSRFFILNPMQFVKEYASLIHKPQNIYRDPLCRWSTPYDSMANLISEKLQKRRASCGMGIWNTVERYNNNIGVTPFSDFCMLPYEEKMSFLYGVKKYYEDKMSIPDDYKGVWNSLGLMAHFIVDCDSMYELTEVSYVQSLYPLYDEVIFENGQGLLLCDTGKDTFDTTPSNTGISYALQMLKGVDTSIQAHYVTRPYLTRHGDGDIMNYSAFRNSLSRSIEEDRTNHFNEFQGEFRYGRLDITSLKNRILRDCKGVNFSVELTHCDEMDRVKEFERRFLEVNTYDSALIK